MRHNQKFDYEGLCAEAANAVAQYAKSQAAVARELGVTRGAVSRALKEAGPTFSDLQRRIIDHLTAYRIEPEPVMFRVVRKDK